MTSSVRYQEYTLATASDANVDDGLACIDSAINFKDITLTSGIAINSSAVVVAWKGCSKILSAVILQISSPGGVNYADTTISSLDSTGKKVTLSVGTANPIPANSTVSLLLIVGN